MVDLPTRSRTKRHSSDGLLPDDDVPVYSRCQLLELLWHHEGLDGRWILREWPKLGSKVFRQRIVDYPALTGRLKHLEERDMALTAKIKDCQARNYVLAKQVKRLEGGKRRRSFSDLKRRAKYKRCNSLVEAAGEPSMVETNEKLAMSHRLAAKRVAVPDNVPVVMSATRAVAIQVQLGLSQRNMQQLHNVCKEFGHNGKSIFPTKTLREAARSECIPEGLEATSVRASVPLESLLRHTISHMPPIFSSVPPTGAGPRRFRLQCKGCIDGSGDHPVMCHPHEEEEKEGRGIGDIDESCRRELSLG